MVKIQVNGFLKYACEQYPKEACAFLYAFRPYSPEERWIVWAVRNVHSEPREGWIPDKSDVASLKRWADKTGHVKIGNIHTHPISGRGFEEDLKPSETDIKFARKFNDIVRGIAVVDRKAFYGIKFHDKFGNDLNIHIESDELR